MQEDEGNENLMNREEKVERRKREQEEREMEVEKSVRTGEKHVQNSKPVCWNKLYSSTGVQACMFVCMLVCVCKCEKKRERSSKD